MVGFNKSYKKGSLLYRKEIDVCSIFLKNFSEKTFVLDECGDVGSAFATGDH